MPPKKVKKVMTQPINVIFSYLQNKKRVHIWLYEDSTTFLSGQIIGFDEYMNMTLDNTVKTYAKSRTKESLGRILLKGDGISLIEEENETVLENYKEKDIDKDKIIKWKTIGIKRETDDEVFEGNYLDTRFEDAEEINNDTDSICRKRTRQKEDEIENKKTKDGY